MQKTNQGFIVPLLIIIIVALLICGGLYIRSEKKSPQTETAPTTQQTNAYTNSKYGFSLVFPDAWAGYRAVEKTNDQNPYISFGIKDQDDVFAISVLTKAQYSEYLKGALQPSHMIGQTETHVFLGGAAQDSTEAVKPIFSDVSSILSTFKLVK